MTRVDEVPTLPVRGKFVFNLLKEALLQERHDPWNPQCTEYMDAVSKLKINESYKVGKVTYQKYWNGALPQKPKCGMFRDYERALGLKHNSLYAISDPEDISTPITRHLRALDGCSRCKLINKKYPISNVKQSIADQCLPPPH